MKRILLALLIFYGYSSSPQIQVGAKAGISIPNLQGDNGKSKGYISRMGGYGGLFINFRITPTFYLQPEINFSPQGGKRNGMQEVPGDAITEITLPPGVNLYADFKNVTILNYLEIPILAKFILGQKFKYFACAGPHVSFLMEAKTKTSGNSPLYLDAVGQVPLMHDGSPFPAVSFNSTTNIKESIKTINAGVQGGLGIEYPVGLGNIFLEGRAIIGLLNIQTHPDIDGKNKTGSLAVAVGYLIKLK